MADTLILNADGQPLSLLPLSTKTWRKAIEDVWTNKAQVLHTYEDWIVRSPSMSMHVPAVIVLNRFQKPKRYVRFSPTLMKLRDRYTCQYCNEVFSGDDLTMDHVQPESLGGKKAWDNIVAACRPCNQNRGNNVKIRPTNEPYRPNYWELVGRRREFVLTVPHESWTYYLDWPENLLRVHG